MVGGGKNPKKMIEISQILISVPDIAVVMLQHIEDTVFQTLFFLTAKNGLFHGKTREEASVPENPTQT